MPFINEYIPEEDKKKYNMTPDNHYYLAGTSSWTVDRERDMFLLPRTGGGPESTPGVRDWAFFWKGNLLDVRLGLIDSGDDALGSHGWERKKLHWIRDLPPALENQKAQVIQDLKDAITARKGLGVLSSYQTYEVVLETE